MEELEVSHYPKGRKALLAYNFTHFTSTNSNNCNH